MLSLRFQAVIKIQGINPYILVSKEYATELRADWKKPMPVLVQVNGKPKEPWHINMMPVGDGSFYLYLHGDVRQSSNTKVGDTVTIDLQFDKSYRNGPLHPMPDLLQKSLEENLIAQENWNNLTPSRQKEVIRYLVTLKSQEAVERNVDKALSVLSGKSLRFMGRDWKEGK